MENIYNNDEIKEVVKKLENEYEFSLSERQVKNIAKKLQDYDFNYEDRLLALEYACRIKNEINNYIRFNVFNYNLKKYYHYNTIDYAIDRVLSIIYDGEIDHIFNSYLEHSVAFVDSLLILEKNKNTKKLVLS